MAGKDGTDAAGDAAAREAARVAVELTEEGRFPGPGAPGRPEVPGEQAAAGPGRPGNPLRALTDRVASTTMTATAAARRGADEAARRGLATARRGAGGARKGAGAARHGAGWPAGASRPAWAG